jgi:hypothetical protein
MSIQRGAFGGLRDDVKPGFRQKRYRDARKLTAAQKRGAQIAAWGKKRKIFR